MSQNELKFAVGMLRAEQGDMDEFEKQDLFQTVIDCGLSKSLGERYEEECQTLIKLGVCSCSQEASRVDMEESIYTNFDLEPEYGEDELMFA